MTPKKHFQHPTLGAFIFKLLRLLCGQNDCLYLSYYICFWGAGSFPQTPADVLPRGCQLLRVAGNTPALYIKRSTFATCG